MNSPRTTNSWISQRQAQGQLLQERARSTGSSADARIWEAYARHTAQMQSVAGQLEAAFRRADSPYRLVHGVTIQTGGHATYLEHIVAGPGGIFLIENLDQQDSAWVRDLERNVAFFRQVAGHAFSCFVIAREPVKIRLPEGCVAVDSADIAIEVIRRDANLETPAAVDEVWHLLDALAMPTTIEPTTIPWWRRIQWQESAFLGAAYFPTILLAVEMDEPFLFSLFMGVLVFLLPACAMLWVVHRIKREPTRKKVLRALLVAAVLFDLILLAGSSLESPNG